MLLSNSEKGCHSCSVPLELINVKSEQKYGFVSVFSVQCSACESINKIKTDTMHGRLSTTKLRKNLFDINTKVALGKYFHYSIF